MTNLNTMTNTQLNGLYTDMMIKAGYDAPSFFKGGKEKLIAKIEALTPKEEPKSETEAKSTSKTKKPATTKFFPKGIFKSKCPQFKNERGKDWKSFDVVLSNGAIVPAKFERNAGTYFYFEHDGACRAGLMENYADLLDSDTNEMNLVVA